jgi:hypothetical protein
MGYIRRDEILDDGTRVDSHDERGDARDRRQEW